jgi:thioredoxin 1
MLGLLRQESGPGNSCVCLMIVGFLLVMTTAVCGKTHPEQEHGVTPAETAPAAGGVEVAPDDTSGGPDLGPDTATQRLPELLDLGATTCIPCKLMAPVLEELRAEYQGRMKVTFIDVRKDAAAATQHRIQIIPTQIFYDASGTEVSRHIGFISKKEILATWEKLGVRFGRRR